MSFFSIPWHAGSFCIMYLDFDWDYTYPEGIASYSEGLPLRGYPGTLTKKIGTLKRFFLPKRPTTTATRLPRCTQAPKERCDISMARQGYDNQALFQGLKDRWINRNASRITPKSSTGLSDLSHWLYSERSPADHADIRLVFQTFSVIDRVSNSDYDITQMHELSISLDKSTGNTLAGRFIQNQAFY